MTAKNEMMFSESSFGRIFLHIGAYKTDRNFKWHMDGIKREVLKMIGVEA